MEEARAALLVVVIGTLMAAVDSTVMILALPTVGTDLKSPLSVIIWTLLIYFLVSAVLTTQMGRLGDILGRSRFYNVGFVVFTVGSLLCGFSRTDLSLIAFRAVQAVGGAMIVANGGAVISDHYPPERRGTAFGYTTLGWSVGAVLGILVGGVFTTYLEWPFIFFINVPIGIFAIALGYAKLRDKERSQARLDLPGFVLLTGVLSLVSYGAIEVASQGAGLTYVVMIVAGALLLFPFLWWEARAPSPTIDLSYFRDRLMSFSLLSAFLQGIGYLSVVFLLTMYLQGVLGLTPLYAAVLLVPGYVISSLLSPFMGRRSDRLGPRTVATGGLLMMIMGVGLYTLFGLHTNPLWVVPVSIVTGFGGAMYWPANNSAIMALARRGSYGSISGLRSTLTAMASLMSFVIAITIAAVSVPRYVAFQVFLGTQNLRGGLASSFLDGIRTSLVVSALVLAVAAIVSFSRPSIHPAHHVRGLERAK